MEGEQFLDDGPSSTVDETDPKFVALEDNGNDSSKEQLEIDSKFTEDAVSTRGALESTPRKETILTSSGKKPCPSPPNEDFEAFRPWAIKGIFPYFES